jgi:hypothetical protein
VPDTFRDWPGFHRRALAHLPRLESLNIHFHPDDLAREPDPKPATE